MGISILKDIRVKISKEENIREVIMMTNMVTSPTMPRESTMMTMPERKVITERKATMVITASTARREDTRDMMNIKDMVVMAMMITKDMAMMITTGVTVMTIIKDMAMMTIK